MNEKQWSQVFELFEGALDLPREERENYIRNACPDATVRQEVEAMLSVEDDADEFLSHLANRAGLAPDMPQLLKPDTRVGAYRIIRLLGEGGMGMVFLAEDTRLNRKVALKFLPPIATASRQKRERFRQEARAAARLNHPNICTVHDIGEYEEQPYLVMEYVEGTTLREVLDRYRRKPEEVGANGNETTGRLPLSKALDFGHQIGRALAAAHRAGVVHRDIKPENIMVTPEERIKVADFGLAKLKDGEPLTRSAQVVGTLAYMSPEQIQGAEADARSDIFSFGIVLYEMITGRHPLAAEHEPTIAYRLVHEDPPPPSSVDDEIRPELDYLLERCLAKNRDDRFASSDEVMNLLDEERRHSSEKAAASRIRRLRWRFLWRARRLVARRKAIGMTAVAVLLLLFSLAIALTWQQGATHGVPEERQLVVLPFENLSEDALPPALSDGLVELVTSTITQLQPQEASMWVVPSTEVRARQISSIDEANRVFGANLALTGSLQGSNDRMRITLNLVEAPSMHQVRSSVLELDLSDINSLQEQVESTLSGMLDLTEDRVAGPPVNDSWGAGATAFRYYTEGRGYLSRHEDLRQVQAAIASFEQALAADPSHALAHAALAEAYWRKYQRTSEPEWTEKAIAHVQRAADLDPAGAEVKVTMAFVKNRTGRHSEAIQLLDQLDAHEQSRFSALMERARAYDGQGRLDSAEETFKRAIEQKRTYWGGYDALGVFYYRHGRFAEAAESFRKITELTPANHQGYNYLGASYFELSDFAQAEAAFEQALAITPDNYAAVSNLATLNYYRGEFEQAVSYYEQALDIRDTDSAVWGNLGSARHWAGYDDDETRNILQRAVELGEGEREVSPNDPRILGQLAGYHALLDNTDEATRLLDRLTSLDALGPPEKVQVGHVYVTLGAPETAISWFEAALDEGIDFSRIERLPGIDELLRDPRMRELQSRFDTPPA